MFIYLASASRLLCFSVLILFRIPLFVISHLNPIGSDINITPRYHCLVSMSHLCYPFLWSSLIFHHYPLHTFVPLLILLHTYIYQLGIGFTPTFYTLLAISHLHSTLRWPFHTYIPLYQFNLNNFFQPMSTCLFLQAATFSPVLKFLMQKLTMMMTVVPAIVPILTRILMMKTPRMSPVLKLKTNQIWMTMRKKHQSIRQLMTFRSLNLFDLCLWHFSSMIYLPNFESSLLRSFWSMLAYNNTWGVKSFFHSSFF